MSDISVVVEMTFESTPHGTDEQFEEFLDAVLEHLNALDREVTLAARLRDRFAAFATSIPGHDFMKAAAAVSVDLRTALHAAGASTAGWPKFEATNETIRKLQDA